MLNLLNDGVSVHFAFRGYDQYVGKVVAPLFIERLDESEKISICVDFEDLKKKMDSRQRQIILPDIDYPDSEIRIVRRLRYLFEDGDAIHYAEITLRKDKVIKLAYVPENLFAFELGAMELTIAGRLPAVA